VETPRFDGPIILDTVCAIRAIIGICHFEKIET
jgi:hypothetical protein